MPTRRCVAPWFTAASRSSLIPADSTVALGWARRSVVGDLGQPREGGVGVGTQRCDGHRAEQLEGVGSGDRVGQCRHVGRARPAASLGTREVHLHQRSEPATGRRRCPVERRHQPQPVDRVDDVAAAGHHRRLVGLHLADEVPHQVGQAGGPAGLGLVGGVGGPVLADVAHAESVQVAHVGRRERLGDRDQGELGPVAAGSPAGRGDPLLELLETGRQLGPPGVVVDLGHDSTTPANRPVTPSRR